MTNALTQARNATTVAEFRAAVPDVIQAVRGVRSDFTIPRGNVILRKLGLELEKQAELRVPITATAVHVTVPYGGETTEELVEQMRALSGQDLWQGAVNREFVAGVPEVIDLSADVDAVPDPDAATDDLHTYKRLFRRLAIQEAADLSWCDSGLNEYLAAMGLRPKAPQYVPVEVTTTRRVLVRVDDADTRDEAREILADEQRRTEAITRELGALRIVDSVVAPAAAPGEPVVGDPDELYWQDVEGTAARCGVRSRWREYVCTRAHGHDGDLHVGATDDRVVRAFWRGDQGTYVSGTGQTVADLDAAQ